eukprot:7013492-Prymnesium_polylepis.2
MADSALSNAHAVLETVSVTPPRGLERASGALLHLKRPRVNLALIVQSGIRKREVPPCLADA